MIVTDVDDILHRGVLTTFILVRTPHVRMPPTKNYGTSASTRDQVAQSRADNKFTHWLHAVLCMPSAVPSHAGATVADIYRTRLDNADQFKQWVEHMTRNHSEAWPVLVGEVMGTAEAHQTVKRFRNRFAWLDRQKTLSTEPFLDIVMQLDSQQLLKRQQGCDAAILPCPGCDEKNLLIKSLRMQLAERGLRECPADEVCIRLANEWFHARYLVGQGETMRQVLKEELEQYLRTEFDANIQLVSGSKLWNAILNGPLRYCKPGDNKHHHLYCRPRVRPLKEWQNPLSAAGYTARQEQMHLKGLYVDPLGRLPVHDPHHTGKCSNRLATTVHGIRRLSTTRGLDLGPAGPATTRDAAAQIAAPGAPTETDKDKTQNDDGVSAPDDAPPVAKKARTTSTNPPEL